MLAATPDEEEGINVSEQTGRAIGEFIEIFGNVLSIDPETKRIGLNLSGLTTEKLEDVGQNLFVYIQEQTHRVYPSKEAADYRRECEERKAPGTEEIFSSGNFLSPAR